VLVESLIKTAGWKPPSNWLINCLNPVVPKDFGADKTRQELSQQCTQYYL